MTTPTVDWAWGADVIAALVVWLAWLWNEGRCSPNNELPAEPGFARREPQRELPLQ